MFDTISARFFKVWKRVSSTEFHPVTPLLSTVIKFQGKCKVGKMKLKFVSFQCRHCYDGHNFQCRLSYGGHNSSVDSLMVVLTSSVDSLMVAIQPPWAIACVNICVHIKNPKHCLNMWKYCTLWHKWVVLFFLLLLLTQVRWPKFSTRDNKIGTKKKNW